jgi:hypothetical protein
MGISRYPAPKFLYIYYSLIGKRNIVIFLIWDKGVNSIIIITYFHLHSGQNE